jgi:hypothetical protein
VKTSRLLSFFEESAAAMSQILSQFMHSRKKICDIHAADFSLVMSWMKYFSLDRNYQAIRICGCDVAYSLPVHAISIENLRHPCRRFFFADVVDEMFLP